MDTYQLIGAVCDNDFPLLQHLIESGESVNVKNKYGYTALHKATAENRLKIFDYLLTLEDIEIDAQTRHGLTALHIALHGYDEDSALKLIEKGSDVNAVTETGCTPLHFAIEFSEKVARVLIEKGAEINARDSDGQTPLHLACQDVYFNGIGMLLYYGADVNIPDNQGVLPFALVLEKCPEYWHEIFFNYTFDQEKIPVHLSILTAAMRRRSPWFRKIVEKTSQVVYDESHLRYFYGCWPWIDSEFFHVFLNKFEYVVQEMFALRTLQTSLRDYFGTLWRFCCNAKEESNKPCVVNKSGQIRQDKSENTVTELICYLLSWGVEVTLKDLDVVYAHYGYCELFKIMLHMDFVVDNNVSSINYSKYCRVWMSTVIYNVDLSTDRCLVEPEECRNYCEFETLFKFFSEPKLKELFSKTLISNNVRMDSIVKVPSLLELARNAARIYIIKKYNVRKCVHFYTVLKWLPISNVYKDILSFQRELYKV